MIYHLKINKQNSLTKINWNQNSTKYTPRFIIISFNQTFSMHSTKGILINIRQEKKKTNNFYHEPYSNTVIIYLNTNNVII